MRLSSLLSLLSFFALLASCTPRRAADPVPPPDGRASNSSGGVVIVEANAGYVDGTASTSGTCGATLTVYDVRVRAGCTIDERVSGTPGVLTYPCGGGPATATFGASVFTGAVTAAGEVDLSIRTGFDFTDGCHWQTKQYLRGNVNSGALSYEYREEPDEGQVGCAGACVANASVTVSR